jgi:hypothetical protein
MSVRYVGKESASEVAAAVGSLTKSGEAEARLLLQRKSGKVEVVAKLKGKSMDRQAANAIKGLVSVGFLAAALAKTNVIRSASQAAAAVKKAVKAARNRVVRGVSQLWGERAVHLLETRASVAKTNDMQKVLTMQSATEKEEQKEGQGKRKKQALPPAFTKLCSRKLMLQQIAEAGGPEELTAKKGWFRLGMDIAGEVGYEPGGYTTRMGDVFKRAYLNLSDQPRGDAAIAKRQRRRLNRVDGGVAGPRLPPPRKIAEQLHTEQAMCRAARIFKEVAGRCVRVVDLVPVLRRKFEENVKSGAIKEPEGEGDSR